MFAALRRNSGISTLAVTCLMALALLMTGCKSPQPSALTPEETTPYGSIKLAEGDALIITFPGSPNLDTSQQVRRDGKIALQLIGEVEAVGKSPSELEKDILALYGDQLVLKEVSVLLQSSAFPVYVSGAVGRPGKILSNRPITALEAIMEVGGFAMGAANMKAVVVLRQDGDSLRHYVVDLKSVLRGEISQRFYLRPADIVYVPEKAF